MQKKIVVVQDRQDEITALWDATKEQKRLPNLLHPHVDEKREYLQ